MPDPRKKATTSTLNEQLRDRGIRHMMYLQRVAGKEEQWMARRFTGLRKTIEEAISPYVSQIESQGAMTVQDRALIQQASLAALQASKEYLGDIWNTVSNKLMDVAEGEHEFEKRLFEKSVPVEWQFNKLSENQLASLAKNPPLQGEPLKSWFTGLSDESANIVNKQLRQGIAEGESMGDMMRRIRGTRSMNYTNGALNTTKKNAQALVRTGVMQSSNRARTGFHEANRDIIKGYENVLTLDSRTCLICVDISSGNPYDVSNKPQPPHHVMCRCVVVAVTKSWKELGFDREEVSPDTRASMNGQVAGDIEYEDWLARQPQQVQIDALGRARYDAWQQGKPLTSFVNREGEIMDLEQLRKMEPDLFNQ